MDRVDLFTANGIQPATEVAGSGGQSEPQALTDGNDHSGFSSLEIAVRKGGESRTRRGARRDNNPESQFSVLADDGDDDWSEEPEFDIGELASNLLPSSPHKLTARHRLERLLEQRRLDMDLRDMFDDDDDERQARRDRRRRQWSRKKRLADA